jgi:hypothetical protein
MDLLHAPPDPNRAFGICGGLGVAIGMPLALWTSEHLGLSLGLTIGLAIAGIATLLATGMVAKILTAEESFVYFRDILPIFAVIAAIVRVIHQPVLTYLDVMAVGAGAFLACGRIGCQLVGCCHGRPSRWGIRYSQSHAECGFPSHYVGVRLFPIQAVESLFVFCLVASGIGIIWRGDPPGTMLSFYIATYAVGRFFIELARGDAERLFLWNFSEAQWTSLLLLWAIVLAEYWRILPASEWHLLAATGLILCLGLITVGRCLDGSHRFKLRHPHHVREIARALRQLSEISFGARVTESAATLAARVPVLITSSGIQLSGSAISEAAREVQHYCLSKKSNALTQAEAATLAHTIALLRNVRGTVPVLQGRSGIFHLLLARDRI